jgi:hypothetical protein
MGFRKVDRNGAQQLPGYTDFLDRKADPATHGASALRLMEHFKSINK